MRRSASKKLLLAVALLTLALLVAYVLAGDWLKGEGRREIATETSTERPQSGPARLPTFDRAIDVEAEGAIAFHEALPLPKRHRMLVRLAEAGNKHASCYLGISLTKCSQSVHLRQQAEALEQRAATMIAGSSEEVDVIDRLIAINQRIESLNAFCGPELLGADNGAFNYLVEAAERGSESASIFLATSPPLDIDNPLAEVERWAKYKTVVPPLLDAAARNGSLTAMYLALGIYSGTDSIVAGGGRFVEPDLVRALAYATVLAARTDHSGLRRRFQAIKERLRVRVSAIQRERASRLAAGLLERRFPPTLRIVSIADLSARQEPADCIPRS